jgi:pimeloyl-ACP methyl ester carboxylesterase
MRVPSGDVRLATETFGSAADPALVLVMGATASMLGWPDGLCRALARRGLRVIRFDHRDTGRSTTMPPGAATHAVEDMAADVLAVLDGHGIPRAHLAGMSLGGYLCQMLALTHPDRVASLTLIASEPLGWDGAPLPHISDAFLAHFTGFATLDWTDRDAVAGFLLGIDRLAASPHAPFDDAAARARIGAVLDRTDSPASMFNHASLDTRSDWTGRFRQIGAPVLVIHGADDPVLPPANGRALAAGLPGATFELLDDVGHELPDRVHDRIAGLVAAHALGAQAQVGGAGRSRGIRFTSL